MLIFCSEWWRLESHAPAATGKQQIRTQRAREGGRSQDERTDGRMHKFVLVRNFTASGLSSPDHNRVSGGIAVVAASGWLRAGRFDPTTRSAPPGPPTRFCEPLLLTCQLFSDPSGQRFQTRGSLKPPTSVTHVRATGKGSTEKARASVPRPWPALTLAFLKVARPYNQGSLKTPDEGCTCQTSG